MNTYPLKHESSSQDELLQQLIQEREKSYSLHITDNNNNLIKLGSVSVIGKNKVRVSLTKEAEPYIGNAFGTDFGSLVGSNKEIEISSLRLANVLGLNINNNTLMKKKMGAFYGNADLNDVVEMAKTHKSDIMISDNDIEAEKGITIISWNAVFASQSCADNYFAQRARMKEHEPMYLRDNGHQLVAADAVVAPNNGGEQARALIHQHAVHKAMADHGIPVARTELVMSSDGKQMMLLKQREGAKPFSAVITASRDFQTLTRNLHRSGGFCSVDRLQAISNGNMIQSADPTAKLMQYAVSRPTLANAIAPLVIYQQMSGMKGNTGNDVGVLLDKNNGKRALKLSFSFNAEPGDATPSQPKTLADLAAIPALSVMAKHHPAEFNVAAGKALLIADSVKMHTGRLNEIGYKTRPVTMKEEREMSVPVYDLSGERQGSAFAKSEKTMDSFLRDRIQKNVSVIER